MDRSAKVSEIIVDGDWFINNTHGDNLLRARVNLATLPKLRHGPDFFLDAGFEGGFLCKFC